jgi:uncharacterized protein (TIGR02231 family)
MDGIFSSNHQMPEITAAPEVREAVEIKKKEEKVTTYELEPKSCPIKAIKIYKNTAQITRDVTFYLEKGEQKVALNGVPVQSLEKSSLRATGTGDALILETFYFLKKERIINDTTTKKNIQKEMKELIEKRELLKKKLLNQKKKIDFIEQFANSIISQKRPHKDLYELVSKETVTELANFQKYYTEQHEIVDKESQLLKSEIEEINEKLLTLNTSFYAEKPTFEDKITHQAIILLEGLKEGNCTLELSYVVSNASWTSSYDLRALSTSEKFNIVYYGNIVQNTGEDWENTKISLSTSDPSTSNSPPPIPGMTLGIRQYSYSYNMSTSTRRREQNEKLDFAMTQSRSLNMPLAPSASVQTVLSQNIEHESMKTVSSTSEKSTTSSVFHIEKSTTIPSDGVSHKVQIGEVEFSGEFNHKCIPKLEPKAYAKVTAVNNSEFPFLEGPMNIFIDHNFVAKGNMKKTLQTEKLETYLGVDPSVKITYVSPHRFQEKKGWIKGTNKMSVNRKIKIKNTKETDVSFKFIFIQRSKLMF